jgi:hypothetical protein
MFSSVTQIINSSTHSPLSPGPSLVEEKGEKVWRDKVLNIEYQMPNDEC